MNGSAILLQTPSLLSVIKQKRRNRHTHFVTECYDYAFTCGPNPDRKDGYDFSINFLDETSDVLTSCIGKIDCP